MVRGGTLTPAQVDAWRRFHRMQAQLIGVLGRELTQATGLSEADAEVLAALAAAPQSTLRARDLRWELAWEKSRLSHQLRRMEQRELVRRTECVEDSRSTVIVLTAKGRAAQLTAERFQQDRVREHLVDALDHDQLEALGEISEAVLQRLGIACTQARAADPDPD
ncbi:MarR family winged helix-turn-helix transcriptional regulator [Microlunatus speluncae]|uniref:MarR family winged helix-turn-helix transcriptional regulator n=1 Tax=Microlunatus speluncae TaxID=2594267 RepID=UPI001375E449|nr:MarR family winged helix-turn-helix transcriptional regulator [Microlunatus speluncae]